MPSLCPAKCVESTHDGLPTCLCPNSYLSTILLTTARTCPRGCSRRPNNSCDCSDRQEAEANASRNLGLIILGAFLVALLFYTALNVLTRLRRCKRMRSDQNDDDDDFADISVLRHPGRNVIRQTCTTTSTVSQSEERSEVVHYTRMGSQTDHPIIMQGNCIPPPYCEMEPKDMPPPYESLYLDPRPDTPTSNDVTDNNNTVYDRGSQFVTVPRVSTTACNSNEIPDINNSNCCR